METKKNQHHASICLFWNTHLQLKHQKLERTVKSGRNFHIKTFCWCVIFIHHGRNEEKITKKIDNKLKKVIDKDLT